MVERMCIVTRAVKPPEELVRFVLSPDEQVTPDLKRKLPGRGVWVTSNKALIEQATLKGGFARGFKQKVQCDTALPDLVERLLHKEALDLISLCNRAGLIITGYEKVSAALQRKPVFAIVNSSDASDDGVRKLHAKARQLKIDPESVSIFNRDELSLALGQTNVVHAAVEKGDLADRLVQAAKRYENFNGSPSGQNDDTAAEQNGLV